MNAVPMTSSVKRLLIAGPKGGIGKTTLSRNLAVAAAMDGLTVGTLDLDLQRSLTKWFSKRPEDMAPITHYEGTMEEEDVQTALDSIKDVELLIIDTPPSIEDHPASFKMLANAADFILIPSGQSEDDLDSVCPWMRFVKKGGNAAAFVLNRVKPHARSFVEAKSTLVSNGRICPIEVPDYEDITYTASLGIGLLELKRGKGSEYMIGVWKFLRAEMEI